jgi:Domain of unknown function (DUF4384)
MKLLNNLVILVLALPIAWAQTPTGLTARELFYTAPAVAKPAASRPAATKPAPAKTVPAKPAPPKPVAQTTPPKPSRMTEPAPEPSGGIPLVNASNSQPAALGLRYSLLKYIGESDFVEVDPEITFRSGEKIRLRVQSNDDAYLYVVMQGSSGAWRVMFPAEEFGEGSNRVLAGRVYDIPGRTRLVFDEQAGVEKLFVILTRQPETQMDKLIYDLDNRQSPGTKPPEKKAGDQRLLMASAAIGNPLIDQLRGGVQSRDLVFEKVDDSKPAPPAAGGMKETAIYVVNASTAPSARLVADIQLRHR